MSSKIASSNTAKVAWIGAAEAARMLDVSRATLYAYVSRGFVRSRATAAGTTRERRYSRDDVERLRRRTEERRDPDKAAARALQWGMPILESAITLIDAGRIYYRGHDVVTLSRTRSLADVASLVWSGGFEVSFAAAAPAPASASASVPPSPAMPVRSSRTPAVVAHARTTQRRVSLALDGAPFVSRAQAALAAASFDDPASFDLQPAGVLRTGWRILNILTRTAAAAGAATASAPTAFEAANRRVMLLAREGVTRQEANRGAIRQERGALAAAARTLAPRKSTVSAIEALESTIDATLAHAWGVKARGVDVIRAALILCADHELNVSSFTARCVASAGSHPYAVVIAGLAALEGTKHGGASARAEAQLASMRRTRDPRGAVAARLRRGETIDGFGHQLYPGGDPRAATLIAAMRERYARSADLAFILEFAEAASTALGDHPNLDFGLAAVSRVLRLPPGSALTLFAIGRTIGWIGHAIEQYATGQLIRPRARYTGVTAGAAGAAGTASGVVAAR